MYSQASSTWYKGGPWRRGSKATPVTQVAKESILAATERASEILTNTQNPTAHATATSTKSPSNHLSRSLKRSYQSSSAGGSTPRSVVSDSSSDPHPAAQQSAESKLVSGHNKDSTARKHASDETPSCASLPKLDPIDKSASKNLTSQTDKVNFESLPWRAWFSRSGEATNPKPPKPPDITLQSGPDGSESIIRRRRNSDPSAASSNTAPNITQEALPRSWLALWAVRPAKVTPTDFAAAAGLDDDRSSSAKTTPNSGDIAVPGNPEPTSTTKIPGWAFWSREGYGEQLTEKAKPDKGDSMFAGSRTETTTASSDANATQRGSNVRPVSVGSARKSLAPNLSPAQNVSDSSANVAGKLTRTEAVEGEPLRGVHGYFPAPLIRSVLGQPTGTSIRFADGAANAIRSWTGAHGYECEIEKVALEGEGRVLERVDMLWKLLLNWIDNVRRSDFIMIACHSQGVPVAIMLIAKLIDFGCVQGARIGVCAMAGVNLGPFIDFKSRWIGGSAGELFEFARSDSQVSKDYYAALTKAVKSGVRIAYIGSIDDQLVSLE
ncbi:MAG: hypothetical protein Q9170_007367, partial [Blastenia crenularia]